MIILILSGIIPSVIAGAIVVRSYTNRAVSLRTSNVQNQCEILSDTLESEDYVHHPDNNLINNELTFLSNIYNGRILIVDSNYNVVRDTYDLDAGKTSVSREVVSCMEGNGASSLYDADNLFIEIIMPIQRADGNIDGVLVASVSTNEINQTVSLMEKQALLIILLISIVVLVVGYFMAGILMKPFRRVTKAIEDITDGYAENAISVPDYTETQQITDAFNTMLSRVRNVDNSRNDFVSNVSHELKTPMTSMKILADSLVGQENIPVEMYQEFMADIVHEIDRENRIIGDLLDMVRMDRKAGGLSLAMVDVGGVLEQIIRRLTPIADQKGISLMLELNTKIEANIDELKLETAFQNLIENGIKYNIEGGWVRVDLRKDKNSFLVSISDSGPGIPEDQHDHIFERFYRVDKSHSSAIEGTGLGLYICQQAVLQHRGSISIYSRVGEGTTFAVRIPLNCEEE
ncbi:MAG: HAMP domain-containing histidine kinase [Lachnospiraceae bacterium]|nr:HAMP domain-containing histidine kinase [Candidatus Equihabitans merdae]